MELLAQTAAVVLEHHASSLLRDTADATLRQSERWLQQALEIANASREQVESLLDAAPLGVYLVDADFRIRQANPTALEAFGGAAHVDELVGRDFNEVIHRLWPPAYADEVGRLFRHTLETGEPSSTRERIEMRRDRGVLEGFEWQVNRIPLPDGRRGVVCYFRDVSMHLRARAALARAEALTAGQKRALERALNGGAINEVLDILAWTGYLVFTEQACTAIYVTDPETGIPALTASAGLSEAYAQSLQNPILLEASPRRRAMILGEMVCIADVQTDEHCAAYRPLAEAHGLRGLWSFPIRSPDGSVLGALSVYRSVQGLPDDDDIESMRLLADTAGMVLERARVVSARERAEAALHRSNRRIREMADAMPQLVWTSDSAGQVDYYNARAAMYDGIGSGPDGGLDWRRILHREDLAPTLVAWQKAVANRRPFSFEHRLRMADGQYRWHLSRAEPAPATAGGSADAVRWFGTATDVHELRAAREALRANEERLMDADRRKDEFIAMLAHELRNPLAPIRTGLEIIRRGAERNADLERIGQIMDRQLTHVVRLIDDLLDASRITSGKLVLKKQPGLLQDMLEGAIEANRAALAAARLEFVVSTPPSPVMLEADPTRFVQVVSNLLNNATKFTPAGGRVSLSARVEDSAEDAQQLVVRVEDTGIGVDAEMLPHIFEMFTQADPGRERSQGGLGIGLALARQLVQMHGGTLTAASAGRGRGSIFEMRLPLPRALPDPMHETRAVAPAACARRVLIIDDNADAADALAMLVTQLGGVAWTANDGRSGIACVAERSPEIVLLDLGMPGMDGYETCRQLRESGSTACIVALTGWGNDRDKLRVLRSGFDAHLTKPADPLQLQELLSAETLPSRPLH
jgi:PAS domain S-box